MREEAGVGDLADESSASGHLLGGFGRLGGGGSGEGRSRVR
jgi:hypothetical protein